MNRALWIVQGLLALFFALGSGAPKLLLPPETLPMPIPLPGPFVRFVGVAEVLGGLGLILPGLLRIRLGLTPLAAVGLVLVTIGATAYNLAAGQPESAAFAVVVGLLCAFVAYGRSRLAPQRANSTRISPFQVMPGPAPDSHDPGEQCAGPGTSTTPTGQGDLS